jgi:hypothetical protein
VPEHQLESYYYNVVLPAKHRLDAEYMAHATFLSDLRLIVDSILRHWDSSVTLRLLNTVAFEPEGRRLLSRAFDPKASSMRVPMQPTVDQSASADQLTTF